MTWTERVGSGGLSTGRYRWGRVAPTANDYIVTFKRGTTHINAFTAHAADDSMTTYNSKDYGGTGTDVYVALNVFGSSTVDTGQKESGVTNSRSASVYEDYNGGGRTQIDISPGQKGGAVGYTHDVVTRSGVSRWYLTTHLATTPGTLEWHGSNSYPTTGGSSTFIQAYASNTVLNEGCVADNGDDTAYGLALSSGSGAIRLTRLNTTTGEGHFEYTPTSWTNAHDRQVGQCFMIGTKFVGIVYNADRDETFIGITDDATSWDNTQVLSGEWVGGAAYDGVGYIACMDSPFEVYTSDGTGDFEDLNDDLPSAPALITLNPEGTGIQAWLQAASIYSYTAPVSDPSGRLHWGARRWGATPWGAFSLGASSAPTPAREWEGWTEAEYETYIDSLISTHTSAWQTLADNYDDQVRHVITGLGFAYEVLGTSSYATLANDLADRVIAAYPATFDMTRDTRMHEGWRYAGTVLSDSVLTDQATAVLEDARNVIVADGSTWRVWSAKSVNETFQFGPYPAGRWQGEFTFTARMAEGYDSTWADALETAFRVDIAETPGYWGAGWNESYAGARVGEKAGRDIEWLLLDRGDDNLREAAMQAWNNLYISGYTFYQFIDGTTQDAGYHDSIFAYDGWALLSQHVPECSQVCHNILDAVSTGDTSIGVTYSLNYHSNGHRQFRLACSLLKAFAGFSA